MSEKNMPLSQAMRLGAMLGPQAFETQREGDATCAIGAARVAVGLSAGVRTWVRWPELANLSAMPCPDCGASKHGLYQVITHLNDSHRWTREAIADYIETIERQIEESNVEYSEHEVASRGELDAF